MSIRGCVECHKMIDEKDVVYIWNDDDEGGPHCSPCADKLVATGDYEYDSDHIICFVCQKPILGKDYDDRHWCHEPGCTRERYEEHGCECDLECHSGCCPVCNGDNPEGYGHPYVDEDKDYEEEAEYSMG